MRLSMINFVAPIAEGSRWTCQLTPSSSEAVSSQAIASSSMTSARIAVLPSQEVIDRLLGDFRRLTAEPLSSVHVLQLEEQLRRADRVLEPRHSRIGTARQEHVLRTQRKTRL